jgi:hypothetical protein
MEVQHMTTDLEYWLGQLIQDEAGLKNAEPASRAVWEDRIRIDQEFIARARKEAKDLSLEEKYDLLFDRVTEEEIAADKAPIKENPFPPPSAEEEERRRLYGIYANSVTLQMPDTDLAFQLSAEQNRNIARAIRALRRHIRKQNGVSDDE